MQLFWTFKLRFDIDILAFRLFVLFLKNWVIFFHSSSYTAYVLLCLIRKMSYHLFHCLIHLLGEENLVQLESMLFIVQLHSLFKKFTNEYQDLGHLPLSLLSSQPWLNFEHLSYLRTNQRYFNKNSTEQHINYNWQDLRCRNAYR